MKENISTLQEAQQGVDIELTRQRILHLQILLQCGHEAPGDVKMLRHFPCHFSSAVSPPREEDDVSQIWQLPGICHGAKVNDPQVFLPKSIVLFFI